MEQQMGRARNMEKFGKLATGLMIVWFIVVAGFGIVLSLMNGTFF
jgi:hypothetical protein